MALFVRRTNTFTNYHFNLLMKMEGRAANDTIHFGEDSALLQYSNAMRKSSKEKYQDQRSPITTTETTVILTPLHSRDVCM